MKILIEAGFKLSAKDESSIKEKLQSLQKFESRMSEITVFFKEDDGTKEKGILAQILIRVPGKDIFVADSETSAMVAFGKAFEAAKRQVKKRREKLNEHQSEVREINEIVNNTY